MYPFHNHFILIVIVGFEIAYRSFRSIVLDSPNEAASLICISTSHGTCQYRWKLFGSKISFIHSTPLIYVNQPGMYECTVVEENGERKSELFDVKLEWTKGTYTSIAWSIVGTAVPSYITKELPYSG